MTEYVRVAGCHPLCKDNRHHYDLLSSKHCPNECGKTLECGGSCCRNKNHDGACECIGDEPGEPGTCPA